MPCLIERSGELVSSGAERSLSGNPNVWQQRMHADELMILNLGHSLPVIYRSTELIVDICEMPEYVD